MKYFALLTFTTFALVSGCTSNEVPPYTEARAEKYAPPQVQVAGLDAAGLRSATAIDPPNQWRDPAGLLYIDVPIRNTSPQVLHVQYRYNFVDDQGRRLAENIAWHTKTLEPGAQEHIVFNSVSRSAADWQMDLRFGR